MVVTSGLLDLSIICLLLLPLEVNENISLFLIFAVWFLLGFLVVLVVISLFFIKRVSYVCEIIPAAAVAKLDVSPRFPITPVSNNSFFNS